MMLFLEEDYEEVLVFTHWFLYLINNFKKAQVSFHYLITKETCRAYFIGADENCYAPSPYLRTYRESKSTTVLQTQEGSLFIPSALGPKSHPTQGNLTRALNKGVWQLIYRQIFVSVTGVAGVTWLARQDERISCLFLVNMTQVLEPVVWSLTFLSVLRHSLILLSKHKQLYCIYAFFYKGYKSIDNIWAKGKHQ